MTDKDSGERKVIEGPDERYIVLCGTCGARTRAYRTKGAETRAWVRGDIIKGEKQ